MILYLDFCAPGLAKSPAGELTARSSRGPRELPSMAACTCMRAAWRSPIFRGFKAYCSPALRMPSRNLAIGAAV